MFRLRSVVVDVGVGLFVRLLDVSCSKSVEEYNRSLDMLTAQVLELCAEGLGLESSTFTKPYLGTAGECTARFNYYPPCPLPSLTLGLGAHTDPNLLTILHQCKVGGLQIYRNGSWLSVKPLTNSFILNIGDSFEVSLSLSLSLSPYSICLKKSFEP